MQLSISFTKLKTRFDSVINTVLLSPWLPLAFAAELWAFSLNAFNLNDMKDWGLISVFPAAIVAAYLLLLFGFAGLFLRERVSETVFASYIMLLILMIHGTPIFLYDTLRYAWAWKHVGIIDYIIRHGAVDPNISILNVYHNWPGFFALNALFTQLAGFSGGQGYSEWAPVFFETLFAFGLLALFRLFTPNRRLQWLSVWFFLLTNWIAQDYFAPQAMAYFMLIGLLLLTIQAFGPRQPLSLAPWKNRLPANWRISRFFNRLHGNIANLNLTAVPYDSTLTGPAQLALGLLALLIFGVIVSSHQLTPFMGLISVLALVLFGIIRWRMLPFWMFVLIILWLVFPARAYNNQVINSTLESFGKIGQTVDSGLVNVALVSPGQAVVAWMGRGLTALIALLSALGFFRRLRKGYLDLPVVLLAGVPIVVLFLNSYGGEALFRVYFFSVPYLSFLAASAIITSNSSKSFRGWMRPVAIGGVSLILLTTFLFAYYGKEKQYSFTQAEVEAAEYLYSHAVPNTLLVEGSRNYPSMFMNYEYFTYVAIDVEPPESQTKLLANPESVLLSWLSDSSRYDASYLFITRSQKIYTDDIGTLPLGSLDKIQAALEKSDQFEIVFSNQDSVIFKVGKRTK